MGKKRIRRAAAYLLSLVMLVTILPAGLNTNTAKAAVKEEFVIEDGILKEYNGTKRIVTVPDGVTEISRSAFAQSNQTDASVEKVILPDSVEIIDNYAFNNCGYLTSVVMSPNLYYLGEGAFYGCERLQQIDLSKSQLSLIQTATFYGCTRMTDVKLPDGIVEIGDNAFIYCRHLGRINLNEGLEVIGESAFYGCEGMNSIELPSTLKSIGEAAFYGCYSLLSIKIPAGVTVLPKQTFWACGSLRKIYLPDTMKVLGDNSLHVKKDYSESMMESIFVPESVTVMAADLFPGGTRSNPYAKLKEYTAFPGSCAESYMKELRVEDEAFSKVEILPAAYDAQIHFDACGGKTEVTSKKGVKGQMYGGLPTPSLKGYTFTGWYADKKFQKKIICTSLIDESDITLYARWEKEKEKQAVTYQGEDADFVIKNGVLEKYQGRQSVVIVPEGVKKISNCFREKCWIRQVVLPQSVEELEDGCFYGCDALVKVNIPKKVTSIPANAFIHCGNLKEVSLEGKVTGIGDYAFSDCSGLEELSLPDSLKTIGEYGFSSCYMLKRIDLPESVETIGKGAFKDCVGLKQIAIPGKVSSLSDSVFNGCEMLSELILGDGVKDIGSDVFWGCTYLHKLYIPESVERIEDEAFYDEGKNKKKKFKLDLYGMDPSATYDVYEMMSTSFEGTDVTFHKLSYDAVIHYDEVSAGVKLEDKKAVTGQAYGPLPEVSGENKKFAGWSDGEKIVRSTDLVDQKAVTLTAVWKDPSEEVKPPVEEEEGEPTLLPKEEQEGEKEYIEISTPEQLNDIRKDLSANYRLTADIDLSEVTSQGGTYDVGGYGWQPIGASTETDTVEPFTGKLDGNGHKITGLTMQGALPYKKVGLFAGIEGGTVQNLVLENCKINNTGDVTFTAALAGYADQGQEREVTIRNVTASGSVSYITDKNAPSRNISMGGILGYVGKGTMENCHNKVDVTYYSSEEEKPTCACSRFLGGVTGYIQKGLVTGCSNEANITIYRKYYGQFHEDTQPGDFVAVALGGLSNYDVTGGICGVAAEDGKVEQCYNAGNLSNCMYNTYSLSSIVTNAYSTAMSGGMVGALFRNTQVLDCYNTGRVYSYSSTKSTIIPEDVDNADELLQAFWKELDSITCSAPFENAHGYASGIVGYSTENSSGPVKNCYNTGRLSGMDGDVYPIAGGDVITFYCRYLNNEDLTVGAGGDSDSLVGCKGYTEEEMKQAGTYRNFDMDNTWFFDEEAGMQTPQLYHNMQSKVSNVKFTSNTLRKSEYQYGESLDLSGFTVSFNMEGVTDPISFTVPDTKECGYDRYKEGKQHLKLSYFGVTEEFDVTVAPKHKHQYKTVFQWNEEDKSCTAKRICETCDVSIPLTCTVRFVREQYIEPDYENPGQEVYEATAVYGEKDYTDVHKFVVPAEEKKDLSECSITKVEDVEYSGDEQRPSVEIRDDDGHWISDSYYHVTYIDNTNAGTATIICTAEEGNIPYKGTIRTTFTILKKEQGLRAVADSTNISVGEKTKVGAAGTIYGKITYQSSDESVASVDENGVVQGLKEGRAVITVSTEGNENYKAASDTITMDVQGAQQPPKPTPSKDPAPTDGPKPTDNPNSTDDPKPTDDPKQTESPKPTEINDKTKDTSSSLTKDNGSQNVKQPENKVTEKRTPKLKKPKIKSIRRLSSRKIKVKWYKVKKVSGYELKCVSGKKTKKYTVSGAGKVSKKIGSLAKGKKYKIRIRCYKWVNGQKVYSSWSTAKAVKMKK